MQKERVRTSLVIGVFLLIVGGNVMVNIGVSAETHPDIEWQQSFFGGSEGGGSRNNRYANCIQQTKDGGYIITGKKDNDLWLLKLDIKGNKEWDSSLPINPSYSENWGEGKSIQQTSYGGYIITTDANMVIKTDNNRIPQWNKAYSSESDSSSSYATSYPPHLQQTTDGGYIVVGTLYYNEIYRYNITEDYRNCWCEVDGEKFFLDDFNFTWEVTISYKGYEMFLSKIDQTGKDIWKKTFGITRDAPQDTNIIYDNVDYLKETTYDANNKYNKYDNETVGFSVKLTNDGGYLINAKTDLFSPGNRSYYMFKTDHNGIEQWHQLLYNKYFLSLDYTSDGGYIATGASYSEYWQSSDVLLFKTDANFNILWNKSFGGRQQAMGLSVQQTTDGGYIIGAGLLEDSTLKFWLIKTDKNGNEIWNKTIEGLSSIKIGDRDTANKGANALQTKDGGYIIAGTLCRGQYCDEKEAYVVKLKSGTSQGLVNLPDTNSNNGGSKDTPGFEIIIILGAIALVMFFRRKRIM